uniref:Ig-like domain-containing protein n=1 Tax=Chelydra serpentina TaxID=8475 RepID=A0A8C3SIJ3_CHESE
GAGPDSPTLRDNYSSASRPACCGLPGFLSINHSFRSDGHSSYSCSSMNSSSRPSIVWAPAVHLRAYPCIHVGTPLYSVTHSSHNLSLQPSPLYQELRKWGFHTLQYKSSCEIQEDGSIGGFLQYAYEGGDFLSFDMNTYTWVAAAKKAEITQRRWNEDAAFLQVVKYYIEKECIEWLMKYQQYGKEALRRREPAAVEVSGKATPDGLTSLFCRVYGFYPRDITVTWMENGEMREQETQRGDILPSGDGTYQIQATLEIDPKEGGRYSCLVDHNSLPEPLNVFWGEERADWPSWGCRPKPGCHFYLGW